MEVFIARQPIFDVRKNVVAYELLFREGLESVLGQIDQTAATASVMANSAIHFGLRELTDEKPAYINVATEVLLDQTAHILPPESIVIEILEHVEVDSRVVRECRRLKEKGYTIALDDLTGDGSHDELLEIANIVKVDFLATDPSKQEKLAVDLIPRGIKLLAEKVESNEVFSLAAGWGYHLFQGYFFARPEVLRRKSTPAHQGHYLELMNTLSTPGLDIDRLESVVKRDATLSVQLLRYINSSFFGVQAKIDTVKHALVLLGRNEIRKWALFLTMSRLTGDKPAELLCTALTRAGCCEALGEKGGLSEHKDVLFLLGMLSVIDAILDRPMEKCLEEVSVDSRIAEALLGGAGKFRDVLDIALLYERGQWNEMDPVAARAGIPINVIPACYFRSANSASELFGTGHATASPA